jgi:CO/xanthine dehydrogenase Mo-binding subunit
VKQQEAGAGWIGASLLRKEDARYLFGQGMYIADVHVPGVQDVAFVRSPMANARVRQVGKPAEAAARVFTLADTSGRSTFWKQAPNFPLIAIALIRRSPTGASVTWDKRSRRA